MSRRTQGARVEVIEDHRTGRSCELRLIKETMTFFVEIDHERFEDKSGDVVRKWAKQKLANELKVDWLRLIIIEVQQDERERRYYHRHHDSEDSLVSAGCAFTARQMYAARLPNGDWRALDPWRYRHYHKSVTQSISESSRFEHAVEAQKGKSETLTFPLIDATGKTPTSRNADGDVTSWDVKDEVVHYLPYSDVLWDALEKIGTVLQREREALNQLLSHVDVIARLTRLSKAGPVPLMIASSSVSANDVRAINEPVVTSPIAERAQRARGRKRS